jgi:hypothetical protein
MFLIACTVIFTVVTIVLRSTFNFVPQSQAIPASLGLNLGVTIFASVFLVCCLCPCIFCAGFQIVLSFGIWSFFSFFLTFFTGEKNKVELPSFFVLPVTFVLKCFKFFETKIWSVVQKVIGGRKK